MNLMQLHDALIQQLGTWDDVEAHPHRFGGTEFRVGSVEIGHIHRGNNMVDIPYTRKLREQLVQEGQTGLHHLLPETGWTTTHLRSEADWERILWLFRLSYLHKVGRRRATPAAEWEALHLSEALRRLVQGSAGSPEDE